MVGDESAVDALGDNAVDKRRDQAVDKDKVDNNPRLLFRGIERVVGGVAHGVGRHKLRIFENARGQRTVVRGTFPEIEVARANDGDIKFRCFCRHHREAFLPGGFAFVVQMRVDMRVPFARLFVLLNSPGAHADGGGVPADGGNIRGVGYPEGSGINDIVLVF